MSAADIHRQITEVYGTETMSDSKVRKWVWKFKNGRTNVDDEECSGRPSVITEDLIQAVETKIRENRNCVHGGYPDYSQRNTKRRGFVISLGFFIRYEKEGDDMLSRIITGDETWVFHIIPE
ncbi:uncharacterized protein TNCV_4864491 [Trichonephila clavipes]|nr:uncharacterized protein TNCV_4864491 [Trichonephila clavipes]